MKSMLSLVVAVTATVGLSANVWYVDDDNYNETFETVQDYIAAGFDGTTTNTAFGTIQMAVNAASANDTIYVCPGVYDKGVTNFVVVGSDCGRTRLVIHKTLRIESLEGPEKTHIVGEWDKTTETGRGPNAVRCLANWATTPVVKGFTIRDGATDAVLNSKGEADDTAKNRGGALYSYRKDSPVYIVDSVVSNCNSSGGGTFRFGCAIRSLICKNTAVSAAVGLQSTFYNCIITGNKASNSWLIYGTGTSLSHCTIFNNTAYRTILHCANTCNNIVFNSASSAGDPEIAGEALAGNVAGKIDGEFQLVAPAIGDFRVRKGSAAEAAAVKEYKNGDNFAYPIPEEFRGFDFYGNPIPDEGIVAGAVQQTAEVKGGGIQFNDVAEGVTVDGKPVIVNKSYIFPTSYPTQFLVKTCFKNNKLFAWLSDHGDFYMESDATRSLYMMPPPQVGTVMTNKPSMVKTEIYLDPVKGSDTEGDGSKDKPYRTLKKGTESTSGNTIVYCEEGVYNEGEMSSWGVNNRIWSDQRSVKFVALKGPVKTIIEGAADPDPKVETQPGCGPAAIRGIAVQGGYFGLEGFTFRNCHTDAKEGDEKEAVGHQGGCFRSSGSSAIIMDSIAESSCASASGNFVGCRLIRCRLVGLGGVPGSSKSTFSGCVIENCGQNQFWPSGSAYHTVLRNSGTLNNHYATICSGGLRVGRNSSTFAGSIMHDFAAYEAGLTGFIKDDPLFASATGAELRRSSPAFTCGEVPTADNYGADYYKYATTDYFGRPISFVDGKPVAGADMLGVFSMFEKRDFEVTSASAGVSELSGGKVTLPAGSSLTADIPATVSETKEYFIAVTVAEGAELKVTLDGAVATYAGGTHLLRVKTADTERAVNFTSVDGLVEIASLRNNAGAVLFLR